MKKINILIVPDSFKETLEAKKVCKIIKKSFRKVFKDAKIKTLALADGGEGSVKSLASNSKSELIKTKVLNPLGKRIDSFYGIVNKTAIIEMAAASGLELLKENEKNPMLTSTYGFGELINHAITQDINKVILCLGGSATNDAGLGMLQALGVSFKDKNDKEVKQGAKYLKDIKTIDLKNLKNKFKNIQIEVACDVDNILCGKKGASYTFARQKGADLKMIKTLDKNLNYFSNICKKHNISKLKKTEDIKGSGAAGGLGYALITFLDACLKSGFKIISEELKLEKYIKKADLIITGEGKMDSQTIYGKTPIGVAKLAKKHNKKVIAICGCLEKGYEIVLEHGIDSVFSSTSISSDFETIKKNAKKNLELSSLNIAKCLKMDLTKKKITSF